MKAWAWLGALVVCCLMLVWLNPPDIIVQTLCGIAWACLAVVGWRHDRSLWNTGIGVVYVLGLGVHYYTTTTLEWVWVVSIIGILLGYFVGRRDATERWDYDPETIRAPGEVVRGPWRSRRL